VATHNLSLDNKQLRIAMKWAAPKKSIDIDFFGAAVEVLLLESIAAACAIDLGLRPLPLTPRN